MSNLYYRTLALPVMVLLVVTLTVGYVPQIAQASAPVALKQMDEAFTQVAEKATPAVVNISASKKMAQRGAVEEIQPFGQDHPFKDFFVVILHVAGAYLALPFFI